VLWNKNRDLNSVFLSQNLRIFYPALIQTTNFVMITDMDMFPTNISFYTDFLQNESISKDDFIYLREIDSQNKQIYMCYNMATPQIWSDVFKIKNEDDISKILETYNPKNFKGIPGEKGWFTDQEIMHKFLYEYKGLKVLNKTHKRL